MSRDRRSSVSFCRSDRAGYFRTANVLRATCIVMVLNPFASTTRFQIGHEGAKESTPIESAVLVKTPVFGRDERLLNELRDLLEGNIHPPHGFQASHGAVVAVEDYAALVGLETLDVTGRRAPVEAAGSQPDVGDVNR